MKIYTASRSLFFYNRVGVFDSSRESFKQLETNVNSSSALFSRAAWWLSTLNCERRYHVHLDTNVVDVGPLTQPGLGLIHYL